eukprot:10453634-Alexandrium_andersonii.AAC.1
MHSGLGVVTSAQSQPPPSPPRALRSPSAAAPGCSGGRQWRSLTGSWWRWLLAAGAARPLL